MSTLERTVSYMPHIKTAKDSSLEAEIKSDIDESLIRGFKNKPRIDSPIDGLSF